MMMIPQRHSEMMMPYYSSFTVVVDNCKIPTPSLLQRIRTREMMERSASRWDPTPMNNASASENLLPLHYSNSSLLSSPHNSNSSFSNNSISGSLNRSPLNQNSFTTTTTTTTSCSTNLGPKVPRRQVSPPALKRDQQETKDADTTTTKESPTTTTTTTTTNDRPSLPVRTRSPLLVQQWSRTDNTCRTTAEDDSDDDDRPNYLPLSPMVPSRHHLPHQQPHQGEQQPRMPKRKSSLKGPPRVVDELAIRRLLQQDNDEDLDLREAELLMDDTATTCTTSSTDHHRHEAVVIATKKSDTTKTTTSEQFIKVLDDDDHPTAPPIQQLLQELQVQQPRSTCSSSQPPALSHRRPSLTTRQSSFQILPATLPTRQSSFEIRNRAAAMTTSPSFSEKVVMKILQHDATRAPPSPPLSSSPSSSLPIILLPKTTEPFATTTTTTSITNDMKAKPLDLLDCCEHHARVTTNSATSSTTNLDNEQHTRSSSTDKATILDKLVNETLHHIEESSHYDKDHHHQDQCPLTPVAASRLPIRQTISPPNSSSSSCGGDSVGSSGNHNKNNRASRQRFRRYRTGAGRPSLPVRTSSLDVAVNGSSHHHHKKEKKNHQSSSRLAAAAGVLPGRQSSFPGVRSTFQQL